LLVISFLLIYVYPKDHNWYFWVVFGIHAFLIILCFFAFRWAIGKWADNQELLDEKIKAESALAVIKVRKKASEYEKTISDLAKEEGFSATSAFAKEHFRKRVERRISKRQRKIRRNKF